MGEFSSIIAIETLFSCATCRRLRWSPYVLITGVQYWLEKHWVCRRYLEGLPPQASSYWWKAAQVEEEEKVSRYQLSRGSIFNGDCSQAQLTTVLVLHGCLYTFVRKRCK